MKDSYIVNLDREKLFIEENIHLLSDNIKTLDNKEFTKLINKYPNIKELLVKFIQINESIKLSFSILGEMIDNEISSELEEDDKKLDSYIKSMHSKLSEIEILIRKKMDLRNKYLFDKYDLNRI